MLEILVLWIIVCVGLWFFGVDGSSIIACNVIVYMLIPFYLFIFMCMVITGTGQYFINLLKGLVG